MVVLFDIDGTLVDCGGAGRRSMELAFEQELGRRDACAGIAFGGMTDRAILRAGLLAIEVEPSDARIDAMIARYLRVLAEELPRWPSFRVLEGAAALVARCRERGLAVGLGTGNVRAGAEVKLGRAQLWDRFDFGGFGCDAEARDRLLEVGRARGARSRGWDPARCPTAIVGDTPKDVAAAHAIGARCLAVTTGRYDRAALEAAGADVVVDSLDAPAAAAALDAWS